jgi:chorismate dehydratase
MGKFCGAANVPGVNSEPPGKSASPSHSGNVRRGGFNHGVEKKTVQMRFFFASAAVCCSAGTKQLNWRDVLSRQMLVSSWSVHALLISEENMRKLRISAITYLNTAPLMWDFEHTAPHSMTGNKERLGSRFDISYTLPSACARALADGTADVGIIPAAAYAEIPGLLILPDIAIASRRAVRSILLLSRMRIDQVRTVALDTSSMTSVALTKVLLEKWLGGARTYTPMDPDLERMLSECDAGLLIGDPALRVDRSPLHTLDLAEEWIRFTGKPFVFAFWAVREAALKEADPSLDLAEVFRDSRDHGLEPEAVSRIAKDWSSRLGMTEAAVRAYLTESIYYQLDPDCLEGLRLFYRCAAEIGALPVAPDLRFLQIPSQTGDHVSAAD